MMMENDENYYKERIYKMPLMKTTSLDWKL